MQDKVEDLGVEDPEIAKLVENLKNLPEYLEERSRKIREKEAFTRHVFEKAFIEAFGTVSPKIFL